MFSLPPWHPQFPGLLKPFVPICLWSQSIQSCHAAATFYDLGLLLQLNKMSSRLTLIHSEVPSARSVCCVQLCCCMQSGETFSLWSSVSRSLWPALIFLMSNPQSTMFCYRWKCITLVLFFVVCTYGIQGGALTAQYFTGSSQSWKLIENRCASQTWAWNQ